jgi:hypothetical protein
MTNYTKTKIGEYNLAQLEVEINSSPSIIPSCLGSSGSGSTITFEFATDLTNDEDIALGTIVAEHVPDKQDFNVSELPLSNTIDGKIAVHSSAKPEPVGSTTFVVWTGAGDNPELPENQSLGEGDLLTFNCSYENTGKHVVSKDVYFDPRHGRVWIHEAYLKFEDGGVPDYITATVMAPPTPLQTMANLDLIIENHMIKYSPGGPGTGTHGFAGTPFLIARDFAKDGDWDYDGTNLLPNMTGHGLYKMSDQEAIVHKYVNKIPCYGTSSSYFTMTSDETSEIPAGYFLRISAHNESNSDWNASVFMEIYRERTTCC